MTTVVRALTRAESGQAGPAGPVRTCIGCRKRAVAAELVRVVVAPGVTGQAGSGPAEQPARGPEPLPVMPDPRRRIPGRGAWLHRDPACADLAERRRAYARALKVARPLDPTPIREYVAAQGMTPTSTTPQELTSNGHSMKRQQ